MGEVIDCAGRALDATRPLVMGILNVTPDSFSDGGAFLSLDAARRHALQMVEDGADLIDVGGESTRPGAASVSGDEELRRVLPVVEVLAGELPVPISVDTSRPEVMRAVAAAGAGLINDIRALRWPGALEAAAEAGLPICLMHMRGEPGTMQRAPHYDDVVGEVAAFLGERIACCEAAGIPGERLLVDPGFGFGKDLAHNLALLAGLPRIADLGRPLLVGLSRKSMIGALTGRSVGERVHGSVAAAVLAVERGARIVRVHDVRATVEALRVVTALL
ncbi:dihydropteroate synthase [Thiococcus pfennigii]|uniref:dihydropteroate synthase n=1 Tax=Thiococcus pfennigii TaxID=1057 RepID=UPI00190890BB|nr:dihydropteroate synthase [Thiococcus pfennigii]MBK1700354.1 dihydropteroate synthase [Thiococcus pfennigii]MBK1731832.1 dihydropteroate synthase [Thiococcus pfennigii]